MDINDAPCMWCATTIKQRRTRYRYAINVLITNGAPGGWWAITSFEKKDKKLLAVAHQGIVRHY